MTMKITLYLLESLSNMISRVLNSMEIQGNDFNLVLVEKAIC